MLLFHKVKKCVQRYTLYLKKLFYLFWSETWKSSGVKYHNYDCHNCSCEINSYKYLKKRRSLLPKSFISFTTCSTRSTNSWVSFTRAIGRYLILIQIMLLLMIFSAIQTMMPLNHSTNLNIKNLELSKRSDEVLGSRQKVKNPKTSITLYITR